MQFSHSRIQIYKACPYKYKLHYLDNLKTVPDQAADNALYLGSALHKGIETNVKTALNEYFKNFYVITDAQINESMKLELLIPKVKELLKNINIYAQEYLISSKRFIGYADLITRNADGTVDIFDFKYSNNVQNYLSSDQLHIYKYFLELKGFKVNRLGFIFIPKISIKQKKTEDLYQFRRRIIEEINNSEIKILPIEYDGNKVAEFFNNIIDIYETTEYTKNPTKLCDWCEYQKYCMEGLDYMLLPENKRREKKIDTNPDMWLYSDSYVGKSTFIDKFDDLLFFNTDGNTDNTTSPVFRIKDEITTTGRLTTRKFAWEVFLDAVSELEKKDNSFKRVAIDLVEDLYEDCRLYMYDKLGIQHEQDAGFGKGWDMVRTEFLTTIKRLKNLGYQIIYISKEIVSEINLKNGSKITTIKPNINDKVANVLAGTVDLTVRAYMDGENRYLQLAKKENIFGGGRFNFKVDKIPLEMPEFIKALTEAQNEVKQHEDKPKEQNKATETKPATEENKDNAVTEGPAVEEHTEEPPKRRHRRKLNESEDK